MKIDDISNYQEFVDSLATNLHSYGPNPSKEWKAEAIRCVDGLAADELRRLVSLEKRKKDGIFFTNSELAEHVLNVLKPTFDKNSIIYDPACGAGNLIIASYNHIQRKSIKLTDQVHFLGSDIHEEFIEAAKLRCTINHLLQKKPTLVNSAKSLFDFSKLNGLEYNDYYQRATDIVINPPFNLTWADEKLEWSAGKVSAAALFIDKVLRNIESGVSIYAILPDVLRSGSRYEKWRNVVRENCVIGTTKLLGQFDKYADVDVFAIKLTKRKKIPHPITKSTTQKGTTQVIADLCDVCVGTVVDNRDLIVGPKRKYIVSKGLKAWTLKTHSDLSRQHNGKSFHGPLVVVKRTSRMGDAQRAQGAIIDMPNPVYIDNHLIILKPKNGTLEECYRIQSVLQDKRTDSWLNSKIRCRHLTVKVVSKIPIWQ